MALNADAAGDNDETDALPYQQCVPFARTASGIQLYGDALTWWDQAQGHYARGRQPKVGAVMSFRPYHAMALGHVATVSRIIDSRTVLLRHANWSPIDGRRGQVEMDVRAVDVSTDNDWSEVRVWYAPIGDLGTTRWPVNGFIYNQKPRGGEGVLLASTNPVPHRSPADTIADAAPARPARIDANFLTGITAERGTVTPRFATNPLFRSTPLRAQPVRSEPARSEPARSEPARSEPVRAWLTAGPPQRATMATAPLLRDDPIGRIIAAHMKRDAG